MQTSYRTSLNKQFDAVLQSTKVVDALCEDDGDCIEKAAVRASHGMRRATAWAACGVHKYVLHDSFSL